MKRSSPELPVGHPQRQDMAARFRRDSRALIFFQELSVSRSFAESSEAGTDGSRKILTAIHLFLRIGSGPTSGTEASRMCAPPDPAFQEASFHLAAAGFRRTPSVVAALILSLAMRK